MNDIDATLKERGSRYGAFADHAAIAQGLQDSMRQWEGWDRLSNVQRQGLTVIADKIARLLNGDPGYLDSVRDIIGYSTLMLDDMNVDGATDTTTIQVTKVDGYWQTKEDLLKKDNTKYDDVPVQGQLFTDAFSAAAAAVSPRYYKLRHGSITAYPEAKEQSIKASPPCVCY